MKQRLCDVTINHNPSWLAILLYIFYPVTMLSWFRYCDEKRNKDGIFLVLFSALGIFNLFVMLMCWCAYAKYPFQSLCVVSVDAAVYIIVGMIHAGIASHQKPQAQIQ